MSRKMKGLRHGDTELPSPGLYETMKPQFDFTMIVNACYMQPNATPATCKPLSKKSGFKK